MDHHDTYNLVCIAEGGQWETTFRTRYGTYEFFVMHYGLMNVPAAFYHFMKGVFKDLLDVCVVVYLDHILIYSENSILHTAHVLEVLRRLRANNLYTKVGKCELNIDTTNVLGLIISPIGLQVADAKVQVVREWPQPKEVEEVQLLLASLTPSVGSSQTIWIGLSPSCD